MASIPQLGYLGQIHALGLDDVVDDGDGVAGEDVFELLTDSAKSLGQCRENIREALTRLEERRK